MIDKTITTLMLIIALIHILPISGALGVSQLSNLYQVNISGKDLEILMRHRAILFGILGSFFAYAAFKPSLQPLAFLAAFISIGSFFFLAFSIGDYNAAIKKVVIADVIAAISLVGAAILYYINHSK